MNALLQHIRLLPGRALIRRVGSGYLWGEVVYAPGLLAGTHVTFDRAEATFQKGKRHYAIVLTRRMRKSDGIEGILPSELSPTESTG